MKQTKSLLMSCVRECWKLVNALNIFYLNSKHLLAGHVHLCIELNVLVELWYLKNLRT